MLSSFKRPEDPNFPVVHYKFVAKSLNGDKLVEYRVQDLPPEYDEKAIDFVMEYFVPDETFCLAAGQEVRDKIPKTLRFFLEDIVKSRVSLVCFVQGSDDIVGLNMLRVESKHEKMMMDEDVEKNVVVSASVYVAEKFDVFEHFQVDHYLSGYGLCVDRAYRGRGIATALLKARAPLLNCLDLKVTSTVFTSLASQKAAASAGYEENCSVPFQEIHHNVPGLNFSDVATADCRICSLKI